MRNWWIRFGCFLTGYNYKIVLSSSEVASKAVKRYTSALLIVSVLWFFVGYMFTQRYLHGNIVKSVFGGGIAIILIMQIERQIILSVSPSGWLYFSRGLIALMMAILGAIIIDQIIFKEDIELEKITFLEKRIQNALPPRTSLINKQISELDSVVKTKETELATLIDEVSRRPVIKTTTPQTNYIPLKRSSKDPNTNFIVQNDTVIRVTSTLTTNVPNPKQDQIAPLNATIAMYRVQKAAKDSALLNVRPQLEKEIKSKTGFLDELEVMYSLVSRSGVALFVWLIWVLFLLALEMLVLIGKILDKKNDYDETVIHQMDLQMKKLKVLASISDGNGLK